MLNSLKSLLVVLVALIPIIFLARRPLSTMLPAANDWNRRAKIWIILTVLSFAAVDFWIFAIGMICVVSYFSADEDNPTLLFLLLMMAVPAMSRPIPGIAGINYLIDLNYLRLLVVTVLLPAAIKISRISATGGFGKVGSDYWIVAFFLIKSAIYFRYSGVAGAVRESIYFIASTWLPYYVASRSLDTKSRVAGCMAAFVLAGTVAGTLAIFEFFKGWGLYRAVADSLRVDALSSPLLRGGSYRAEGSSGQPIILGALLSICLGFWLYVQYNLPNRWWRCLTFAAISGGLVATLSRGPWVGAAVTIFVYLLLAPSGFKNILKWTGIGAVIAGMVLVSPNADTILSYLPFTENNVDAGSSDYRERLFEISMAILSQYPWFGTPYFLSYMESMRQGQGIIDLVNTYLVVALPTGGIGLFVWIFPILFSVAMGVKSALGARADSVESTDYRRMTASVTASLVGLMVVLGTTSPIHATPYILWLLVGMGVALPRVGKLTYAAR